MLLISGRITTNSQRNCSNNNSNNNIANNSTNNNECNEQNQTNVPLNDIDLPLV